MEWYLVATQNITKRIKVVLSLIPMSPLIQFKKEKINYENNYSNSLGLKKTPPSFCTLPVQFSIKFQSLESNLNYKQTVKYI